MTTSLRQLLSHASLALTCTLALGAAACDTGDASLADPVESAQSASVIEGPWAFVSSDVQPSTSYSIQGDQIDLNFNGYFSWSGTWASGYRGYTFASPVQIEAGGTYQLTLKVTNRTNGIPVVLKAALSGAGPEQSATIFADSATLSFTVTSPGCAPELDLTAHPVLGHLGPTEGIGIGVSSYSVTASLVRTN